jgi:hypothetical protein
VGSKANVDSYCEQALNANDTNRKLDHIARAIAELADFVDDQENDIKRIKRATNA